MLFHQGIIFQMQSYKEHDHVFEEGCVGFVYTLLLLDNYHSDQNATRYVLSHHAHSTEITCCTWFRQISFPTNDRTFYVYLRKFTYS